MRTDDDDVWMRREDHQEATADSWERTRDLITKHARHNQKSHGRRGPGQRSMGSPRKRLRGAVPTSAEGGRSTANPGHRASVDIPSRERSRANSSLEEWERGWQSIDGSAFPAYNHKEAFAAGLTVNEAEAEAILIQNHFALGRSTRQLPFEAQAGRQHGMPLPRDRRAQVASFFNAHGISHDMTASQFDDWLGSLKSDVESPVEIKRLRGWKSFHPAQNNEEAERRERAIKAGFLGAVLYAAQELDIRSPIRMITDRDYEWEPGSPPGQEEPAAYAATIGPGSGALEVAANVSAMSDLMRQWNRSGTSEDIRQDLATSMSISGTRSVSDGMTSTPVAGIPMLMDTFGLEMPDDDLDTSNEMAGFLLGISAGLHEMGHIAHSVRTQVGITDSRGFGWSVNRARPNDPDPNPAYLLMEAWYTQHTRNEIRNQALTEYSTQSPREMVAEAYVAHLLGWPSLGPQYDGILRTLVFPTRQGDTGRFTDSWGGVTKAYARPDTIRILARRAASQSQADEEAPIRDDFGLRKVIASLQVMNHG